MINRFLNIFRTPKAGPEQKTTERPRPVMGLDDIQYGMVNQEALDEALAFNFSTDKHPIDQIRKKATMAGVAMDAGGPGVNIKSAFFGNQTITQGQMFWYAQQTFIGYQLCAMLAQQWLVSKACWMPAEDATRKGYEVTVNDGQEIDSEVIDYIRKQDVKFSVNRNLIQAIGFGRVFGIRIVMFKVKSNDPEYYFKPFNPDGITPGSYEGMSQIDPYWITPQLDPESAGDPSSIHFYEPTWWNIAGKLVHRSHLIVYRTEEVADILKPTYIYGGIPIPQKIYNRVYAAERTANEAPILALAKRTTVVNMDLSQVAAKEATFIKRMNWWAEMWTNFGIKAVNLEEKVNQFDTSLADFDAVIMSQYQLVAAAANVPAVKLLGTSPKGFNATGEFEEANYHEMLESIQTHAGTAILNRHHLLLIRSEVCPKFGIAPFDTTITWKSLDTMTAKEKAEINRFKAETGAILVNSGTIDGMDERERIITDPDSGYSGLINENPENPPIVESSDPAEAESGAV